MVAPLADTLTPMTDELTPTRRWQALVPELRSFTLQGQPSERGGQSPECAPPMTDADSAAAKAEVGRANAEAEQAEALTRAEAANEALEIVCPLANGDVQDWDALAALWYVAWLTQATHPR